MVVPTLGAVTEHTAGNPGEVAVEPALLQSSMMSLGFMRLFVSSFGRGLTNMTGNASSLGLLFSSVVINYAKALEDLMFDFGAMDEVHFGQPKTPSNEFASSISEDYYPLKAS